MTKGASDRWCYSGQLGSFRFDREEPTVAAGANVDEYGGFEYVVSGAQVINFSSSFALQMREVESAARSLLIRLQHVEARGPQEFDRAFAAMARERAEALLFWLTGPQLSWHTGPGLLNSR